MFLDGTKKPHGPYQPNVIIHGGAGAISRSNLPPELYQQYHKSLLKYLTSSKALLEEGKSALDVACYAVSCMEDDPLFNCGRGSVFTKAGTIEMEASIMVTSVDAAGPPEGSIKRAAAVSLVRNTRHPIRLAREVLLHADRDDGLGGTSTMHCHLSGRDVEKWGCEERGLERKNDDWFWTKRRWEEHRKGLSDQHLEKDAGDPNDLLDNLDLPSQGTVGAVCLDCWGNLAVATSTGGLTNKAPGRIGDTPTVGAGFWAESWQETMQEHLLPEPALPTNLKRLLRDALAETIRPCLFFNLSVSGSSPKLNHRHTACGPQIEAAQPLLLLYSSPGQPLYKTKTSRRAVAMSGTGNGDSFLRTNAVRTAAAMARFDPVHPSLSKVISAIADPDGELQRSAGDRWQKTGEGQGGIIGIEVSRAGDLDVFSRIKGTAVFGFNCGGLWRAYYEWDPDNGKDVPRVMVFRDEY